MNRQFQFFCHYFILVITDGYGIEDVLYVWTHGPSKSIKMASDMRMSQFDLIGHPAGNLTAKNPQGTSRHQVHQWQVSESQNV